jgi:hypothetical protein
MSERQAHSFVAVRRDQRLQGALLTLMNGAYVRQCGNVKQAIGGGWVPIEQLRPESPFDFLFMVMAMDYALRPGQPARVLLETPDLR